MLLIVERVLLLKKVSLFANIDDDVLVNLAGAMEEQEFKAGETIIEEGDTGRELFIIAEGTVRIHKGDKTLRMMERNTFFGELAALDPQPRTASVTAAEETRTLKLDNTVLLEELMNNGLLALGIIHFLIDRFRDLKA
jgi:CRP-like cAMP-binding protein